MRMRLVSCVKLWVSLILCFAFFAAWDAVAQDWDRINVTPGSWNDVDLNDVCFADGQGWAVGEDGTIIHTYSGERWHDQISGVSVDLNGVYFDSVWDGWVVGSHGTVLRTEDSGITWEQQTFDVDLYDVHFAGNRYGWAVGKDGTILNTIDGGDTWTQDEFGIYDLHSVYFYDNDNGWAAGQNGTILYWNGSEWAQQQSNTNEDLYGLYFTTKTDGWIVGDRGTILHTSDGLIWTDWKARAPANEFRLRSIYFASEDRRYGWIAGEEGTIMRTGDFGGNWWMADLSVSRDLNGVWASSTNEVWVMGDDGAMLRSTNLGESWEFFTNPPYEDFWDISFNAKVSWDTGSLVDLEGWIVGDDGVILRMEEDGINWREHPSPTDNNLYSIHMLDKYNGWAVGNVGTVIHTRDGVKWELEEFTTSQNLRGVYFTSLDNGWVVGDNGIIRHWDGVDWNTQVSGVRLTLYGIYFADNSEGWAVGDSGTVLYTSNGGQNWRRIDSSTSETLYAIYFVNSDNGWIVGSNGTVLHVDDDEFTRQNSHTPVNLYDVDFLDTSRGWIAAADGMTISTPNGGDRWDTHLIGFIRGDLYGIDFADWKTGFAVGENGVVLRYVSPAPSVEIELIAPQGDIMTLTPTFKWESDNPGLEHRIFLDNDTNPFHEPMHVFSTINTTSYTVDEPLAQGTYYWGIEMIDGTRSAPEYLQFTAWPPTEVTLISPSGYISEDSPTFEWDCNNTELSDIGLITYTLFIDDDGTPYDGVNISVGKDLSHTLSSLDPLSSLSEGQYSWGVKTSGLESVESSVFIFIVDLSPPTGTVKIDDGAEFTNSLTVTLALTASDPLFAEDGRGSGVSEMRLSNDGSDWSEPEAFADTKIWDLSQYGGDLDDGEKTVYVLYGDNLGHWMTTPVIDTITLDTVPPTGTISINDGAEVTGPTGVVLSLSASDDRSGVGNMILSNDGREWWSPALPYQTSRSWIFTIYGGNDDEGVKTVYVKYVDKAGNWMTEPASDDIELDSTGPTGTVVINDDEPLTNLLMVDLTLSASDKNGVQSMQFTNGAGKWSLPEPYSTERENWDLSAEEYGGNSDPGKKTVYVKFIDSVGNVSAQAVSDDITFKTEVSVSVEISSPEVEGKIKNNDLVSVAGTFEPGATLVAMEVLDESGEPLDMDLEDVTYETEIGQITGSFNVGELTAKTIQFKLAVEDALGNPGDATSNILTVDNEPPGNTRVRINQVSPFSSTSISLTISATDALEIYVDGDVVGMKKWIAFAEKLEIELTEGDGVKEVRVGFRDDMKNESAELIAQITLDTTPPTGTIVINDGAEFTKILLVKLTLWAVDENSVESYRLSNNGDDWSEELPYDADQAAGTPLQLDEWDLSDYGGDSDEGQKTVYVKYKDKAGNWSDPKSDDITVDTTAPTISVQLVENKQEAMEPVAITAIIKSDRPITEANLHYRRKGSQEYTTAPMTKLPGDYYTGEIPGSEVTLDGVEYYVSASDDRYTVTHPAVDAPIAPKSFTVVDTTRPLIEHDPVIRSPVNSSPKITAKVTDAMGVKKVTLFHKLAKDRDFTAIDMVAGVAPDEYSADIPALDTLGVVEYYIEAVDTSSNSRTSPAQGANQPYAISFVDVEPPEVVHTRIADGQEAGSPVTVGATVTDNMTVDSVQLKYKQSAKREFVEVDMTRIGSYYSAEIPGSVIIPGNIDYVITASDGSPQSEDTEVSYSFTVVDTTPPEIKLTFAPSQVEVHNEARVETEVKDNVGVEDVKLYYKGVEDTAFEIADMTRVGNRYSVAIPGQSRPGEVKFYVYAEDRYGVSATEPAVDPQNAPRVITVTDVSGPAIQHSPVLGVQEAGISVSITATVTDDVEVADVSLHYRTAGQDTYELISMTRSGATSLYRGNVPVSAVILPGVEYYIRAVDDSSNVTTHPAVNPDTLPHSFSVVDTVPPEIVYDPAGLETVLITEPIVVTVEATDLTGIKEVRVLYRAEGEDSFDSQTLEDMGDGNFSATIPTPSIEGTVYYYIQAEDNSGNKATSPTEEPAARPYLILIRDPFPPAPPTQLTASSAPGGRIILTWELSASSDTDRYNIYTDSASGTVDYSTVYDSVDSATKTWESPALGEGVYKFVVRAIDGSGNEEDNTASVSAKADATKPEPVTNLAAESLPGGRIQLSWALSVSRDAAAYNIYWDNAQASIDYSNPLARVNDPASSWTSGKLEDKMYRFVVRCQDDAGNEEENSDLKSARADATPPGSVSSLRSTTHDLNVWSSDAQVKVRWNPATDAGTGLAGYSIVWDASERTMPDETMDMGDEFTATGQLSGRTYFHIRAVDKAGNWSSEAAHLGPFLIDTQPPEPPASLTAAPLAGGKVRLNWQESASADVVRYHVYWDSGTGRGIDYTNPVATLDGLSWTSSALEDSRTYQFSVRAEDQAGNEEKNTQRATGVADSQPPSITHKPIAGMLAQEIMSASIEAIVTDASGVESAMLHYRKRGATSYEDVEMAKGNGNSYSAEIPSSTFSSAGVDYYLSASDEAGNMSDNPVITIQVSTSLRARILASSENEIIVGDGTSIYIPAGAVSQDTYLDITVPGTIPPPQTGLKRHIITREFGLDAGLSKPIRFTLRYTDEKAAGEDESKLAAYVWDGQRWTFLNAVDPGADQAIIETTQLGIFSVIGDYQPPEVSDLRPSGYAEPGGMITAGVRDNGSGINPQSIEVSLNGQLIDVPASALRDGQLSLAPPQSIREGKYSVQLLVSDNTGNQTVATSSFQVVGELALRDVYCYPNPFHPTKGVSFAYTLTEPVDKVTIRIFGMDGKMMKEIDGSTTVGENHVRWDCRDEMDDVILSSVYICHIEAEGAKDTRTETIKIAGWE